MKALRQIYEALRPLIVCLGLVELTWISIWLLNTPEGPSGYLTTVMLWILGMLAWLVLVIYLGRRGTFQKYTNLLSNLVGVTLVIAFAVVIFGITEVGRDGLLKAAWGTSDLQLVVIHILRLLAIGTLIKYFQGQFPLHFALFGALPDFLFAGSAVYLTVFLSSGSLGNNTLLLWHAIGFLIFLGAGISMFFSVPSPLRLTQKKPDTSLVFQYPMVLAPNYTVPLFMLAHAFAWVKYLG